VRPGETRALGGNKVFGIEGVNGESFALLNRCPHEGAPLEKAACVARLTSASELLQISQQ